MGDVGLFVVNHGVLLGSLDVGPRLQLLGDVEVQVGLHVGDQEGSGDQNDREGNGAVKDNLEALGIGRLEAGADGGLDGRGNVGDRRKVASGDASIQGGQGGVGQAGLGGGGTHVLGNVGRQLGVKNRNVHGLGDGAAEGADGAHDAGGEANVLGLLDEGDTGKGDVVDVADGNKTQDAEGEAQCVCAAGDAGDRGDKGHGAHGSNDGLGLDAGHVAEGEATEDLAEQDTATDDGRLPANGEDVRGVEGADDGGPEDGHAVINHGANGGHNDDANKATVLEQAGRHEGLDLAEVGLPDDESDNGGEADEQGAQGLHAGPGVDAAAPGQADEEEDAATDKQENTDIVNLLDGLPLGLAGDVQLVVARRVVQEEEEDGGDAVEDDADVVAPAPAGGGVVNKGAGDDRAEDGKGQTRQEADGDDDTTVLVGDELAEGDAKRQLAGGREAVEQVGADEGVDVLGDGADDAADEGQNGGAHDHPLAAKDVGETADEQKADAGAQGPDGGDPVDVGGVAELGVDEGEGVGGQDPAEIGADGSTADGLVGRGC